MNPIISVQMHIERERENMKRRLIATTAEQQANAGPASTSFKSVSLQPPPSSISARRSSMPSQPVPSNATQKRDLKLTVSCSCNGEV